MTATSSYTTVWSSDTWCISRENISIKLQRTATSYYSKIIGYTGHIGKENRHFNRTEQRHRTATWSQDTSTHDWTHHRHVQETEWTTTSLSGCRLSSHTRIKERNRQLGTTAYFGSVKRDSSGSRYLVRSMMLHNVCHLCIVYMWIGENRYIV